MNRLRTVGLFSLSFLAVAAIGGLLASASTSSDGGVAGPPATIAERGPEGYASADAPPLGAAPREPPPSELFDEGRITKAVEEDGITVDTSTLDDGQVCLRVTDRSGHTFTCGSQEQVDGGRLTLLVMDPDRRIVVAGVAPRGADSIVSSSGDVAAVENGAWLLVDVSTEPKSPGEIYEFGVVYRVGDEIMAEVEV